MKLPGQVQEWPIARLIPYARNARTHSDAQIKQIAASMSEFGWTIPMLVAEDGTIIAGHGRLAAAQLLGLEIAPVVVATGWSEAQRRAYTLADNKLAANAGWDEALLALELSDLNAFDFDVGLIGFADGELRSMNVGPEGGGSDQGIDYEEKFAVLVECESEAQQQKTFEQLTEQGLTCRVLVN